MPINWKHIVNAILNQEAIGRYGMRNDGTAKGPGYYGELPGIGPNQGYTMTENSIGVNFANKEQEIPTIVPSLSREELELVLSGGMNEAIVNKSIQHAKKRMSQGLSPFASFEDIVIPAPKFNSKK